MTPKEKPIQIKCYCGHTIYCDCGPIEEPKENNHIVDTNEMVYPKTAFEILQPKITIADTLEFREKHLPEILDAMEEYATSSQTEISDEEIEKASYDQATFAPSFIAGAKWYREQLKK